MRRSGRSIILPSETHRFIDADFLQAEAGSLYYARGFSKGRRVKKDDPMSRLYVAESGLTTGSMADHRLRMASSHLLAFAAKLVAVAYPQAETTLAPYYQGVTIDAKWIEACVADLMANRGAALVVARGHLPPEVTRSFTASTRSLVPSVRR